MNKKIYSVSEFKAKSLGLLDRVARNGETITITKRGKEIAKVIPITTPSQRPQPGGLKDALLSEGDLLTPLGSKLWNASK